MINDFKLFGFEHIISIIMPIVIGILFMLLIIRYPKKRTLISLLFAVTIVITRSVRYVFDIQLGDFSVLDLLSLHVCNIDLYLLILCMVWPNRNLFVFTFLIGIPTALAVALLPGQTHPEPGMARAMFFIMSHTMLVMGSIYLLVAYRFVITKKDVLFYYAASLIGVVLIYIFNVLTGANYMYLMNGPRNTVLETMYSFLGPIMYVFAIYFILVGLFSILFVIYKFLVVKILKNITDLDSKNT